MSLYLRDYVLVKPHDLSRLQSLYDNLNPDDLSPHEWYDTQGYQGLDKECTSLVYYPAIGSEMSSLILEVVHGSLETYQNQISNWPGIRQSSVGRINTYREGDSMDEHVDHISTLFTPPTRGIPILSIVGLLNDNFEGGNFTLCGEEMNLSAGDVVVFPSCFLYPHSVGLVTKGERVSFVSWAW